MGNSPADLKETMRSKTDEELYLLLRVHSLAQTPQVLTVASEEFRRRQLDEPTMSRIMAAAERELDTLAASQQAEIEEPALAVLMRLGWLILFFIIGCAIYGGYEGLDSIGWISHREDTMISARSDWLVGESKECWSATLNSDGATLLGKEVGSMSGVSCDDGPEHNIKVTFYGRKVQPEYKTVSWRCTRNEVSFLNDNNSFACYQTGGQQ
jgi:hypothetical protein